jgi:hypothetical protein
MSDYVHNLETRAARAVLVIALAGISVLGVASLGLYAWHVYRLATMH